MCRKVDVDGLFAQPTAGKVPRGTSKRVVFNEPLPATAGDAYSAVPLIGAVAHIAVRMRPDFNDPIPGFEA